MLVGGLLVSFKNGCDFKLENVNLKEKFEEHYPSELTIKGTIYPNVVIESHGRYYEMKAPKKAISIQFDPKTGRIFESPLKSS